MKKSLIPLVAAAALACGGAWAAERLDAAALDEITAGTTHVQSVQVVGYGAVIGVVKIKGNLAIATAEAKAYGDNTFAKSATAVATTPYSSSSKSAAIAATGPSAPNY